MFPDQTPKAHPRVKRAGVESEEERTWVAFYARVRHDATVASDVLTQLDADPELKRARLALYLCCKESVRTHKARQVRDKRIVQAIRYLLHALLVRPVLALRRALSLTGSIVIECLPASTTTMTTRRERAAPAMLRPATGSGVPTRHTTVGDGTPEDAIPEATAPRPRVAGRA